MSAETLADTALPLIEAAGFQASLPASLQIGQELRARGYFEAGLVAQWKLVQESLWTRIQDMADPLRALQLWSSHPEAKVRFFAPGLWAHWGEIHPQVALRGLLALADDPDFRVLEATQAFGLRPFAQDLGPSVRELLEDWFVHPSPKVRRAAMTAIRPRGFWVSHLQWAVDNPAFLAPVLEKFSREENRFPANSVANCLNDISHVQPLFVLGVLQRWLESGASAQGEHMARKGLRSLIKAGDTRALHLLGFDPVEVDFTVSLKQDAIVAPNSNLCFDLSLDNRGNPCDVELVYEIETTGRNLMRPRRKKYQGGCHFLPQGISVLQVRERVFDRKAAPLIDGKAAARFFLNGIFKAQVDFRIKR